MLMCHNFMMISSEWLVLGLLKSFRGEGDNNSKKLAIGSRRPHSLMNTIDDR